MIQLQIHSSKRNVIVSLPVFIILALGIISVFPFQSSNAQIEPALASHYIENEFCIDKHSTTGLLYCETTGLDTNIGDLLTVVLSCNSGATFAMSSNLLTILDITDESSNVYVRAGTNSGNVNPNNATYPTATMEVAGFYVQSALSTNTGNITVVVQNLFGYNNVNATGCVLYVEDVPIRITGFELVNSISGPLTNDAGLFPPFTQKEQYFPCFNLNPCVNNEYFFHYTYGAYYYSPPNENTARPLSVIPFYPLKEVSPSKWFSTTGISIETSETTVLNNLNTHFSFNETISCTYVGFNCGRYSVTSPMTEGASWVLGSITMAFLTSNTGSPCFYTTFTSNYPKDSSSSNQLISNVTYVNWFQIPSESVNTVSINKIQVNIKNITNIPNGNARITLAVYSGNELSPAIFLPLQIQTWIISNTNTPRNLTMFTNLNLNPDSFAYIALTTLNDGVFVYNSTGGKIIGIDYNDVFDTNPTHEQYQVMPYELTGYSINQANVNMFAQLVISCKEHINQNTVTTTTTTTTTTTISCNAPQIIDLTSLLSLLNTWPLWLLPLLMGGLFGMIGLFIGLVMAMVFGTLTGLVQIWSDIMVLLGIVLIMVRREI